MIEIAFRSDDGPLVIQVGQPVATPEADRPWAVEVRLNGRSKNIAGEDPLEALVLAALFAESYATATEGLDPPVNSLPWTQLPPLLAQGFREGLFAVLDVRGIPCPDEARARIAACADPVMLQRFLVRAKTAASADDVFADVLLGQVPER